MKVPSCCTAIEIADSALEALQYGNEQVKQLVALLKAIEHDAHQNEGYISEELFNLGKSLSSDCAEYLGEEAEHLQADLNAVRGVQ